MKHDFYKYYKMGQLSYAQERKQEEEDRMYNFNLNHAMARQEAELGLNDMYLIKRDIENGDYYTYNDLKLFCIESWIRNGMKTIKNNDEDNYTKEQNEIREFIIENMTDEFFPYFMDHHMRYPLAWDYCKLHKI